MNVLVTGVGSLLGQSIIKALKASEISCHILGTDYFPHAVGLYWVEKGFILPDVLSPKVSREQWVEAVSKIIKDEHIDIVFVGLDFEVEIFSQLKEQFESKSPVKIVVSDPKACAICKDKYATAQFLKSKGFPFPDSALPEEAEEFLKQHSFPFIVKSRFGFRSWHLYTVKDRLELENALKVCPTPVIQELVGTPDEEYTSGSLSLNGDILSVVVLRRILKDGNTFRAVLDERCFAFHDFIKQVSGALQAHGPMNFQFRDTARGPVIFEINPRFSGTTYMRALVGVNEVEIFLRALMGKEQLEITYKKGVILRYFEEQFVPGDVYQKWESK
ncbi:MAG: ATP-grasp domain-containing protein [Candidatus Omnitrophica bacterium]|nr:ATP-grasp domain-containing protein [Candidatus Omnitrophota bacterium]